MLQHKGFLFKMRDKKSVLPSPRKGILVNETARSAAFLFQLNDSINGITDLVFISTNTLTKNRLYARFVWLPCISILTIEDTSRENAEARTKNFLMNIFIILILKLRILRRSLLSFRNQNFNIYEPKLWANCLRWWEYVYHTNSSKTDLFHLKNQRNTNLRSVMAKFLSQAKKCTWKSTWVIHWSTKPFI